MSIFVIAEAACTWHIGSSAKIHLAKMIKCIHVAKRSGADAVKFQWTSAPAEMAARRKISNVGAYHRLAWPAKWLPILAAECEDAGIEFMCTIYLPQDIAVIAPFVKRFKVASLEATDSALFAAMAECAMPVICSLGGLDARDVTYWPHLDHCKKLQCTVSYPCDAKDMNLGAIAFSVNDGFVIHGLSDHSADVMTGALAVACGAEIIEVHFRLDETKGGNPDYKHSLNPAGLVAYVKNIRKAEVMLGDGVKKIEECERPLIKHRVVA